MSCQAATEAVGFHLRHRRILYVDPDTDSREITSMLLGLEGYDVVAADSTADALHKAKTGGFDLYVLDAWLDRGGVELCLELRAFDQHSPIIFFSGAATSLLAAQAIQAGAEAFIAKPDIDRLKEYIEEVFARPSAKETETKPLAVVC